MTQNATQPQERKYVKEQRRDVEGENFNSNAHLKGVPEGKIKKV